MLKTQKFIYLKNLLFIAFLFFTLNTYAQKKLDITAEQSTLKLLIEKIEKDTDYTFIFNSSINLSQKISFNITQQPIDYILKKAFTDNEIDYEMAGKQIILKKREKSNTKTISGIIVDDIGVPVIGANIVEKNKRIGTVSDIDGKFTLNNVQVPVTLQVSYIGYISKDVTSDGNAPLNIILHENKEILDEVVVIGYGTQKKVNLTGAVSTISAKEINKRPVVSAANALQGLDPSVNLNMGTGSPESTYSIDIRGAVSINSGTPLVLADGIEVNLRQINPNDIESISVLKDASASAIYGAKASAGVILITTKKGSTEGKTKISYSGRIGWSQNTTSTDFNTIGYEHVTMANRFYNSYNGVDMFLYPEANGELQKLLDRRNDKSENPARPWVEVGSDGKYYYYANFDWFGYFYNRTRSQHEHNISITGGTDKFNYYVSGRYLRQNGVFKIFGDTFEDYSFRTKMNAAITPWLRYSNNINFDKSEMKYPGRPEYEQTISSLQSNISPAFMPLNPDGSIVQYTNQLYANSPLGTGYAGSMTANNTINSKTNRYMIIKNQFDADITKDLTLTASYGYKMRDPMNRYRNNTFEYSRALDQFATFTSGAVENAYTENRYTETESNVEVYATYKKMWDKKHNFTLVGGTQYTDYSYRTMQGKQTDLSNDDLATFAVANGVITLNQTINTLRTLGHFGRINYDYEGRYLFEASARADGSSRFKKGSRWAFFPSFSTGWRVSEEKLFEPLKGAWSNFKLRFSMGSLGNQQVERYYSYIDEISIDNVMNYTFDNVNKANRASVSNPISTDLTWETVTTYNLGLDLSFLRNRLSFTTDLYIRDTKDMLIPPTPLPSVFGAPTPRQNNADLRTKGFEIYLKWNDRFTLASKPFEYGITVTLGDYLTKITKYENPNKVLSSLYEGAVLGEIWGYRVAGLFATDQEAAEYQSRIDDKAVNQRVYGSKGVNENYLRAGDMKFMDLDGDNIISQGSGTVDSPGDQRIIGNSLPRYSYSFRFDLSWNNIDVSAFFQGVGKRNWYPSNGQSSFDFWGPYAFPSTSFVHKDFENNCWSEENTGAYFPRQRGYQAYSGGSLGEVNDRYLQNVAYLRLKNLTVGYTLPLLKNKIQQIRVALSGENLFYWSPLKKYTKTIDPELTLSSNTYNSNSGVGYFYSKSFSVNLDITF